MCLFIYTQYTKIGNVTFLKYTMYTLSSIISIHIYLHLYTFMAYILIEKLSNISKY